MTVKLVVLYAQPDDAEAFDKHYFDVHGPLVDDIPGLERWDTAQVVGAADGGELDFYRITELYFPDQDTLAASMGGDEGARAAADYGQMAPPGSRMFVADVR